MNSEPPKRDVIFLVADRNIEAAIRGLLGRTESLDIGRVTFEIHTLPTRDPGCYRHAHEFLRPFHRRYAHAMVIFDREGCGKHAEPRVALQEEVDDRLARTGWGNRAKTIVLDPELEAWVWSDSPEVDAALGWTQRSPALRTWLVDQGFLRPDQAKPDRPKEAVEEALRVARKPRSSAIYQELAGKVSLRRCTDEAFQEFKTTLQEWFPAK